jgi:hypothetical protein
MPSVHACRRQASRRFFCLVNKADIQSCQRQINSSADKDESYNQKLLPKNRAQQKR